MAALAKLRRFSHQHIIMIASVHLMAIQAVLHDRGMFPSEGTPFLGVAFITEIVDRIGLYHFFSESAVRIVTACTAHPSFLYRMMRLLVNQGPYILVAAEAEVGLCRL